MCVYICIVYCVCVYISVYSACVCFYNAHICIYAYNVCELCIMHMFNVYIGAHVHAYTYICIHI